MEPLSSVRPQVGEADLSENLFQGELLVVLGGVSLSHHVHHRLQHTVGVVVPVGRESCLLYLVYILWWRESESEREREREREIRIKLKALSGFLIVTLVWCKINKLLNVINSSFTVYVTYTNNC